MDRKKQIEPTALLRPMASMLFDPCSIQESMGWGGPRPTYPWFDIVEFSPGPPRDGTDSSEDLLGTRTKSVLQFSSKMSKFFLNGYFDEKR